MFKLKPVPTTRLDTEAVIPEIAITSGVSPSAVVPRRPQTIYVPDAIQVCPVTVTL
jgi:hypothetical protein